MHFWAKTCSALIALWLLACLWQLWTFAPSALNTGNRYVLRSLVFSFEQATLSTLFSLALALPLLWGAWAGRLQWLRHLLSITTILPTLLFILVIFEWSTLLNLFFTQKIELRGLWGIVLLHALLNAPLLALLLLPTLERIPENYHKQRQLLRQSALTYSWRILLPLTKPALLHGLSLVFLLCFTSFTTPLILGGDPRYANLEVAIYQAVKYEFNLPLAAQLALLQIIVLLPLFALMPSNPPKSTTHPPAKIPHHISATVCEILGLIMLLSPLIIIAINSMQYFTLQPPKALFSATQDSIKLAFITVPLALLLHLILLHERHAQRLMEALYLMPTLILCLGSYLIAKPYFSLFAYPYLANALLLTLTVQPYLYKFAYPSFSQHQAQTAKLKQTLALNGKTRFFQIDLPALAPLWAKVAGLALIICVGDVAVARFYTNTQFQTLAAYLSEELGHYRQAKAWQTSAYFLLVSLVLYWLPQLITKIYFKMRQP